MWAYFSFILFIIIIIGFSNFMGKRAFDNLTVKRSFENNKLNIGEETRIFTEVVNKKPIPVPFLMVRERFPLNIGCEGKGFRYLSGKCYEKDFIFRIWWYRRARQSAVIKAAKRGVFFFNSLNVTAGDFLGIYSESRELEDFVELLVYPKLLKFQDMLFTSSSILGENLIKRWIYKDPLYVRGIRKYNVEDRMKDIHWQSSLKLGKLMVRDYDFTSDLELVFITLVQCGTPYYSSIDEDKVDETISVAVSLAMEALKLSVPVGMMTDAQMSYFNGSYINSVEPSINSFPSILELMARANYAPKGEMDKFLMEKAASFVSQRVYVIVASYISEEAAGIITKLRRAGMNFKIVDTSGNGSVKNIPLIEKIDYKGVQNDKVQAS